MDGRNFDELTKTISTSASRRTLAKGIGAGALASALGVFGLQAASAQDVEAEASCKGSNRKCSDNEDCCSGRCKRTTVRNSNKKKKVCVCRNKGGNCIVDGKRKNKACCSGKCKSNGKCR